MHASSYFLSLTNACKFFLNIFIIIDGIVINGRDLEIHENSFLNYWGLIKTVKL